ncbi:hypothetical protein HX857_34690, partial [Pseudomonas gingeri]|nr:hypothetical protein [Pseudomonas gingeri]
SAVLLSESRLLGFLPRELPSQVLLVEEREDWLADCPDSAPLSLIDGQNLAYVIYT